MEFQCKRLEQLLDTLKREKNLKSWTEHNNEFGTVLTIRCTHKPKRLATREDNQSTAISSDSISALSSDANPNTGTRVKDNSSETNSTSNTREHPADPIPPTSVTPTRTVYKPVSQYQMKRDQGRRDAFKNRCTTRSRTTQSMDKQSVELKRDISQDDSIDSNICISPDSVVVSESPWADKNPYSCLEVDFDVNSETGSRIYEEITPLMAKPLASGEPESSAEVEVEYDEKPIAQKMSEEICAKTKALVAALTARMEAG